MTSETVVTSQNSENIAQNGENPAINSDNSENATDIAPVKKVLSPAALRALAEAEERRKAQMPNSMPKEYGGRKDGTEPTRFGDWEKSGIAHDF